MPTKRDLSRRVAALGGDPDDPEEIVINDSLVTEASEDSELFARTRIWRDGFGVWHSNRTDLRDETTSGDSEGSS